LRNTGKSEREKIKGNKMIYENIKKHLGEKWEKGSH